MAHHNFELSDGMKQILGLDKYIGPTGQYPEGQYGKHDEGEIRFAVAADTRADRVVVNFGKPVHSLAMTQQQAEELADLLQKKAWALRGIS